MMNEVPLGVQSYCFRNFKNNDEVAGMVKDIGLAAIEVCAVHADFKNPSMFQGVIDSYKKKGVSILTTGVNGISGNEAEDRKMFDFLKMCGAKYMSVNFGLDNLDQALASAEKLSEEYNVRLGIHIHGGKHWLSNTPALKWLFKKTSPRVGLNLDTAWALDAGEDPIKMMQEFKARLYILHLKDFTFDRARKHTDVVVGTGNIDLTAVNKTLTEINFNGVAIIEYEGDAANPVPALKGCTEAITAKIPFKK